MNKSSYLLITLTKILFVQINNANLYEKFLVFYDITKNLIFNHNPNLNITKKELKKLFLFATSQTHFLFNNKFYDLIDGVAMGSALAPLLANILMSFYESKWIIEDNLNKPKF